jgi:hypothetical protein
MPQETVDPPPHGDLAGGGEMGLRVRTRDWSAASLGPLARWPQGLLRLAGRMLDSRPVAAASPRGH